MNDKIFGYSWEAIQRAQQGGPLHEPVNRDTPDQQAEKIYQDVRRFKIAVHKDVKAQLAITLPNSYKLVGDYWTHVE